MELILQHTCERKNKDKILQNQFPIAFSKLVPNRTDDKPNPFLGSGYYFWDTNLDQAKNWGKLHYANNYFIFEAKADYTHLYNNRLILDLAGDRNAMLFFLNLMKAAAKDNPANGNMRINEFIDYLYNLPNNPKFPFEVIRAEDYSHKHPNYNSQKKHFDATNQNHYTHLNPYFVVCIKKHNPSLLIDFQLKE